MATNNSECCRDERCPGNLPDCHEYTCAGRRAWLALSADVRLGGAAARWARTNPGKTADDFAAAMRTTFLTHEWVVIRDSFRFVAQEG